MGWRERYRALKGRYDALLAEYGAVALGTYLVIFAGSVLVFYLGIEAGVEWEGKASDAGKLLAAYGLSKAIQPGRIVATLVLTPLVARLIRVLRGRPSLVRELDREIEE